MIKPKPISKVKAPSKARAIGNGIAVGIALFCLVLGFVLVWSGFDIAPKTQSPVAYVSFGPMVTRVPGYAFSTTMAVQTSAADAKWTTQNRKAISAVLQEALAKVDPHALRTPDGLAGLQETLKLATNRTLQTEQVQNVLLTDFVLEKDGR